MNETEWCWRAFSGLSALELYNILALREAVFVVEQNAPQVDADGKDPHAEHLLGTVGRELIAYLRIIPRGVQFEDA